MMRDRDRTLFLARRSYRQRRLRDVLRMLPLVAIVLWLIPLLWAAGDDLPADTSQVGIYVFAVWVVVVAFTSLLAFWINPDVDSELGGEERD